MNLNSNFQWMNPPEKFVIANDELEIYTRENTDFWQRTHYGFQNDNGHFLYTFVNGDFDLSAKITSFFKNQYDQAGIMVRYSNFTWIKTSVEYEKPGIAFLGSVVTRFGYSDWATQFYDPKNKEITLKLCRKADDFSIFFLKEKEWIQQRICHLEREQNELMVGFYSCSPKNGGFRSIFSDMILKKIENVY